MIMPADSPREAVVSRNGEAVRLQKTDGGGAEGSTGKNKDSWVRGRAGMHYLDLIPDRAEGKVIASRIRLVSGGPVSDNVHYHKVDFQLIYCLAGRIKAVYQDQGPPFWLEPGDCVLQPPEIRHRVLEAEAGSEVLEVSSPAEHETWIDHELSLPNAELDTERDFGGQRFVRHVASTANWHEFYERRVRYRDTGLADATRGVAAVNVLRVPSEAAEPISLTSGRTGFEFVYICSGRLELVEGEIVLHDVTEGAGTVVPGRPGILRTFHPGTTAVCVQIPESRPYEMWPDTIN
jgi:mannose-6-phosphate isomerase-like protein (cupin superfamily)